MCRDQYVHRVIIAPFRGQRTIALVCAVATCLSVVSGSAAAIQSAWRQVSPVNLDVASFAPVDSITLVIVGHNGSVTRTTNGGLDWQFQSNVAGVAGTLSDVEFLDRDTGFAVGDWDGHDNVGVLIRSDDGGVSWRAIDLGLSVGPLRWVRFAPDGRHGWISGADDLQIRTHDGGRSWERIFPSPLAYLAGKFVDSLNGYTTAHGLLWWTHDGGEIWDSVYRFSDVSVGSVDFADTLSGWATGMVWSGPGYSRLLKTTDGGRTWAVAASHKYEMYDQVVCVDTDRVVVSVSGYDQLLETFGSIIETHDRGRSWTSAAWSSSYPHFMRRGPTGSVWARMVNGAIFRSRNVGERWAAVVEVKYGYPRAIAHVPGHPAWVVAGGGYGMTEDQLSVSPDSGRSWKDAPRQAGCYCMMEALSFPEGADGWAAGKVVLKTTDGGMSWFPQSSLVYPYWNLKGIFGADSRLIWGVGSTVLRSTDGGSSWTDLQTSAWRGLRSIWFMSPLQGVVVGDSGMVLVTSDGGRVWRPVGTAVTARLNSVFFISPFHGWIVGNGGMGLRTTDGGLSWSQGGLIGSFDLRQVVFIDTLRGWAAGGGAIAGTTDGGLTWEVEHRQGGGWYFYGLDVAEGSLAMAIGANYITLALDIPVSSAPGEPTPIFPPDQASDIAADPFFQWYPPSGGGSYQIQVSEDSLFGTREVDLSHLRYTWRQVRSLKPATVYSWRLRAKNRLGYSEWSPARRFRTGVFPPAEVVPVSPAPGASVRWDSLRFAWHPVRMGTTHYWVEVSPDSLFQEVVLDSAIIDTTWAPASVRGGSVLWWRVRAGNQFGWGPFSDMRMVSLVLGSIDGLPGLPSEAGIAQNYPNPFNPVTTIAAQWPATSEVRLTVFDILGREVATLGAGKYPAGAYRFTFEAAGLPSGIYICRLKAGAYHGAIKMILLR